MIDKEEKGKKEGRKERHKKGQKRKYIGRRGEARLIDRKRQRVGVHGIINCGVKEIEVQRITESLILSNVMN